jgi:hypothetical protein
MGLSGRDLEACRGWGELEWNGRKDFQRPPTIFLITALLLK